MTEVAYFHVDEAVIQAPPARCYELVLAARRYGEWWRLVRCEVLGAEGMLRVGSRYRMARRAGELGGRGGRARPRIARIDLRYADGDMLGPVRWEFLRRGRRHPRPLRLPRRAPEQRVHRGLVRQRPQPAPARARRCARTPSPACARVLEVAAGDTSGGDLFDALHSQRAVRRFRPDPIADAVLREILAAATRAPERPQRPAVGLRRRP